MKSIKYYTLSKHNGKWCVWLNLEGGRGFGCSNKFKSESRKECLNWCKENNIVLRRNKI